MGAKWEGRYYDWNAALDAADKLWPEKDTKEYAGESLVLDSVMMGKWKEYIISWRTIPCCIVLRINDISRPKML